MRETVWLGITNHLGREFMWDADSMTEHGWVRWPDPIKLPDLLKGTEEGSLRMIGGKLYKKMSLMEYENLPD